MESSLFDGSNPLGQKFARLTEYCVCHRCQARPLSASLIAADRTCLSDLPPETTALHTTLPRCDSITLFRASVTALARFAPSYRAIRGAECHRGPRKPPHTIDRPTTTKASSLPARRSPSRRATATSTARPRSQMATLLLRSQPLLPLRQ